MIDLSVADQQPRNRRKLVSRPLHVARGASLFKSREEVRRRPAILAVIVMPVMEEPDRHVEVRRVAAERLFQLAAVSAQPIAFAQESLIESPRLFVSPERIERTDVKRFGLASTLEFKENVDLFCEEVIFLVGEGGLVLAQRAERLIEIPLLDQMINELFDDLERGGV
ncbi:MAG TPA: hypothetical protein VHL99_12835 [Candidatus Binatia bacterium]|nr:hypothetical protein [Candidatus Binatia bacterium]